MFKICTPGILVMHVGDTNPAHGAHWKWGGGSEMVTQSHFFCSICPGTVETSLSTAYASLIIRSRTVVWDVLSKHLSM